MNIYLNPCRILVFIFSILISFSITAQTDTSFWFAVPQLAHQHGATADPVYAYFRISTYKQAATVTIEQPAGGGFVKKILSIPANGFQTVDVSANIIPAMNNVLECYPGNTIQNKGIHISSTSPVNVYYEYLYWKNPEIFTLKGRNALGTSFIVPSQNNYANSTDATINPPAKGSIDIVASEDGTVVTINPSIAVEGGSGINPININLKKGQTYSIRALDVAAGPHLGGTIITSNKPIAVTYKDDSLLCTGWDDIGDQIIPSSLCGTEYICMKGNFIGTGGEFVYVTAIENNTTVYNNGTLFGTINKGKILAIPLTSACQYIKTTKPTYAFQVSGFENEIGGALLPPIGCRGSRDVAFLRSDAMQQNFRLLLVVRKGAQGNFKLNGLPYSANFQNVPSNSNYVYAVIDDDISYSKFKLNTSYVLSNSSDLFQLGILGFNQTSGGASFGYFSDFASDTVYSKVTHYSGCKITLNAGAGKNSYQWIANNYYKQFNSSDTIQTYIVQNPDTTQSTTDTIIVKTTVLGCTSFEKMIVTFTFPKIIKERYMCHGDKETLSIPNDFYYTSFKWWDGDVVSKTKVVDSTARYSIKLYDDGCPPATSYFNVTIAPLPYAIGRDTTVCTGFKSIQFNANKQSGVSYKWSTGDTTQISTILEKPISALTTDVYTVTITNSCIPPQTVSAEYKVTIQPCDIIIPNVFTPNNDGVNDVFIVKNIEYLDWEVLIYNRWGRKVFEQKGYNNSDKVWTGEGCSEGVYYYIVRYKKDVRKGYIQLLR